LSQSFIRLALDRLPECRLVNLDELTYAGNRRNLSEIQNDPRYRFVKGDICDRDLVDQLFSEELNIL
jgi:dTDP-glucose 4,6-dehydratase